MSEEKNVHLVVGASLKRERYSYMAVQRLHEIGKQIYAWGLREGNIGPINVRSDFPEGRTDIHTITLYMNPKRQEEWIPSFLALKPKRIIFNPGTENSKLMDKALAAGIECLEACTLVMIASRTYD
jgi:predicted CoA-binding protein